VASPFYGTTFYDRNMLIDEYPIEEARGIPNCGHRYNIIYFVLICRLISFAYVLILIFGIYFKVTMQQFG
jgi:hypothetical protein